MSTDNEQTTLPSSGSEMLIPLGKLKKSPRNARRTPPSTAAIEALAASIAAKGMLQNLVVEPEQDEQGRPTGCWLVTVGEGRRLAQLLRVRRREIRKSEPIRCIVDTTHDPHEISLDENVTREPMHPADQHAAFRRLAEERGLGAEEIAARFGVSVQVVRQRLRLSAVSPRLLQIYRDGGLTLDQLMAFAITEDHERQEQVHAQLSWNREPGHIRRELTRSHAPASDRRAILVGVEAYREAGGTILRDLFTEDGGGFLEDVALLDRLALARLEQIAAEVRAAEGWRWSAADLDHPHGHGFGRVLPHPIERSPADQAAYAAAQARYAACSTSHEDVGEPLDEVAEELRALAAELERLARPQTGYDPDDVARAGVLVSLAYDGTARIERGLIRPEDEKPAPQADRRGTGEAVTEDGEVVPGSQDEGSVPTGSESGDPEEAASDTGRPLPEALVRDLTAHRTLGLRLALGEQPVLALLAVTHALAAQTFWRASEAHCLDLRPTSAPLAGHADGIADTAAAMRLAERHAAWAAELPREVADLWGFLEALDPARVPALLAHCASLTVQAVRLPWDHRPLAHRTADRLASALGLDMTAHWTATVRSWLGRVTKAHILAAVREAVGEEAADRIAALRKRPMAEAAEALLAATGWLPALLRTAEAPERAARPEAEAVQAVPVSDPGHSIAAE